MTGSRAHLGSSLFDGLEPDFTLEEVGALLGVSDHTAMLAEKSAEKKLRAIFAALKAESLREFISMSEDAVSNVLKTFPAHDRQYSQKLGWYTLSRARSLNDGTESLRSMASVYAALRVESANRFRIPLLFRERRRDAFVNLGHVEAIAMLGEQCLFRSAALRKLLRNRAKAELGAVAITESEFGTDLAGRFEIPIILAVFVTHRES